MHTVRVQGEVLTVKVCGETVDCRGFISTTSLLVRVFPRRLTSGGDF